MSSALTNPPNTGDPPIQIDPRDWVEVLRVLDQTVPTLQVWAFGSRARRTAKPYSDLDLALVSPTPLTLEQLATVNDAFDSSDLAIRVDVVDWAMISEPFREIINRDKVPIQSAS
jgi:predicted nucleotidyltransferase